MDLDPEPSPLHGQQDLMIHSVDNIMPCICVVIGYHHLRGGKDGEFTLYHIREQCLGMGN